MVNVQVNVITCCVIREVGSKTKTSLLPIGEIKMIQTICEEQQNMYPQSLSVGNLEFPRISQLGSLDDEQGVNGLGLKDETPKPVLAIIYNGI
jgi:hypothetical protein